MSNQISKGLGENQVNVPKGLGIEDEEQDLYTIVLNIEAEVYQDIKYFPATGTHSIEEDVKGWLWNKN